MNENFKIEVEKRITDYDMEIINSFYLPLIGTSAVILFSHLNSKVKDNNFDYQTTITKNELFSQINIKEERFNKSKKFLEAVGLIRTFFSEYYNEYLILVKKPLEIDLILQNRLLMSKIEDKIGVENLEKLIAKFQPKSISKDEYEDVSAKFYEVFPINLESKSKIIFENNLETKHETKKTNSEKDDRNTEKYIEFLTKRVAKPSTVKKINKYLTHFNQKAINEIIDFCFKVNDKLNISYFETIAKDLIKKEIFEANYIKAELSEALDFKNKQTDIFKSKSSNDVEQPFFEDFSYTYDSSLNNTASMKLDDILSIIVQDEKDE
ncbi:DnaD domain protein [Mesomycoplasma lagogenitalium]|uniref:DnaD domain protein n=1 Tax=Mesomycoplasma lagogenitalium TaxID=171286 RepID=A0ABY8LWE7_9BACT|nr:DnaD domain protein [Mesomycoplasma lagogenitalium]WGI36447.1 DnaD domain protein [Mesomycoplasma lagogenitalium]